MNIVDKKEMVLSVREGIQFCIDNGIEAAQSQLESFDKNKKLATNQKETLRKNLECLADEVIVTGGGNKGKVILTGLKDSPSKRITGNVTNGNKATDLDLIMDEGIMRGLVLRIRDGDSASYTVNNWADNLFLFRLGSNDWSKLGETFVENYKDYMDEEKMVNMLKTVKENSQTRRIDVIRRSFKKLEFEGRIFTTEEYMEEEYIDPEEHSEEEYKKLYDNRYKEISKKAFEEMEAYEKAKVDSLGVEWSKFAQAKARKPFAPKEGKRILKEVAKYMREEFQIERYFKKIKVQILDDDHNEEIDNKQLNEAFVKRFLELTYSRPINNDDYTNGKSYSKQLYVANVLLLLKQTGYGNLIESELEAEIKNIGKNIEKVKLTNLIKNNIEEDQRPVGFPATNQNQPTIEEVDKAFEQQKEIPVDVTHLFNDSKEEVIEPKIVNEEMEWMLRMSRFAKKKERVETVPPKPVQASKKTKEGMIDISQICIEEEEIEVKAEVDNRPFGWQLEVVEKKQAKLDDSLMPLKGNYTIKPQRPCPRKSGSMYLMDLEKYYNAIAI